MAFEQERHVLECAGHHVSVYQRSNWEIESYPGAKGLALLARTAWSFETQREVAKVLERERPHLVHVHNTFFMISPSIYAACHDANVPVVQTLHNYRLFCPGGAFFRNGHLCEECVEHSVWRGARYGCYRESRPATTAVAVMLAVNRMLHTWDRLVDCYIAPSEFARRKFVEAGLPPEKTCVKFNFVHPDPGEAVDAGEYALCVGRLSPEKQVGTLLAAWRHLHSRIPLFIVGSGRQRLELEGIAARHDLATVRFEGQLPRDRTLATIKAARFLVFCSGWYDIFPHVIVEAFACGIPVICPRLGVMQEIVADGHSGLHFAPGNPADLAEKVEWAWAHPASMRAMGREARKEYETKYTAEKTYGTLMEIYQNVLRPVSDR